MDRHRAKAGSISTPVTVLAQGIAAPLPTPLCEGAVSRSLSLILPVRNAEQQLAGAVARVLDILPDITRSFEILIIDQGSSDHTLEVAEELAIEYPQIRVGCAMHSDAVQFGIQQSRGEIVISHDGTSELNVAELCRLCDSARAQTIPAGIGRAPLASNKSWRAQPAAAPQRGLTPALRMHDRDAIARLRRSVAAVQQLNFHQRAVPTLPQPTPKAAPAQTPVKMNPAHNSAPQQSIQRAPNYLSKLREKLQKLVTDE
jgi:glycosyltransferase involved in cell wall biosynthesis